MSTPRRLERLPSYELPGGIRLAIAATPRSRLVGLMGLGVVDRSDALLLPRCRSVHTVGMRFAVDLIWLDGAGRVVHSEPAVRAGRLRACRRARAVVEAPAGAGVRVAAALAAAPDEGGSFFELTGRRRGAAGLLDRTGPGIAERPVCPPSVCR